MTAPPMKTLALQLLARAVSSKALDFSQLLKKRYCQALFLTAFTLTAQTPQELVAKRCLPCHNNQLENANLSFEDRDKVLAKTNKILAAITHKGDIKMPPGPKLPDPEIATLTAWIRNGAPGLKASANPTRHFPFELWTFDRLDTIAGYPTKVEGHPRV